MATFPWDDHVEGSPTTLLSTGLNSLASGSRAASSVQADNRKRFGTFELVFDFGTAPAADMPIYVWLLQRPDGTNAEDGADGSVTPSKPPDIVFTSRAVNTAQRQVRRHVEMPNGDWYALLLNSAGQTLEASGNTLKVWTYDVESV